MNSKELEFKLDKRIALFENHLNYQMSSLEVRNIFFKSACEIIPHLISQAFIIRQLNFNMQMIISQPIPRFKVGGLIERGKVDSNGDAFVKGCFDKSKNVNLLKYIKR